MSNTLLPIELDTAMSPMPAHRRRRGQKREERKRGTTGERVGGAVGSIVNGSGAKTADRAVSIFDDEPKNKRG